jgi:hypothetical protein
VSWLRSALTLDLATQPCPRTCPGHPFATSLMLTRTNRMWYSFIHVLLRRVLATCSLASRFTSHLGHKELGVLER